MNASTRIPTTASKPRIIYFGTPDYAVPSLTALAGDARFDVVMVVTQPDRPVGRKRVVTPPPVKTAALEFGFEVFQPETLRIADARQVLIDQMPDLFVVAAYGLILGGKSLAIPSCGSLNLHASLLPKFRGASPISASLERGEAVTGVTLMQMDLGIDTGAMVSSLSMPIAPTDTTLSLTHRLADLAADLLIRDLDRYLAGDLIPIAQPDEGVSLTRMLTKNDGWIDWDQDAVSIERHVRAMWSWPRAWTTVNDRSLQIHEAAVEMESSGGKPGRLAVVSGWPVVACGAGSLRLVRVQPEGGKPIPGSDWVKGLKESSTDLGETRRPDGLPPRIIELNPPGGEP